MTMIVCKFFFCFLSLLTTPNVKNSHTLALKNVQDQTSKSFKTKFGPYEKVLESNFQTKANFGSFCQSIDLAFS